MKPADKLELARMFKSQGLVVAMAGDGINVTLRRWRAGREHRHGSRHRRVAIERAQVTLVKRDLRAIGDARGLSEASVRNMRQNLMFAFLYNALGIPLAAGVVYPWTGWLLSPMIAALAMSLSSMFPGR